MGMRRPVAKSRTLFETQSLPEGFRLQEEFLDPSEEADLIARFRAMEFHEVRMRGVAARRRVVQYGYKYSFETLRMTEGPSLPEFLVAIRDRAATFAGLASGDLSEALVTEYAPGAPIGWHRDAPGFGVVVGISLSAAARFRFRRGKVGAWQTTEVRLAPRSIYVLTGPARTEWQHCIPPVDDLRYSVTFRTLRKKRT
jgi:alkylated DNA repair dioxygenase AlkB